MEKKGWKQIAAGVAVSIVGIVGLTSCENKKENQDNDTWTAKSREEGVTITRPAHGFDFSTPETRLKESKQNIKAYHERAAFKDGDLKVEFGYENALESMRQRIDEKYGYTAGLKKMEQMNQAIKDNSLFKNDEDSEVKRALGNSTSVYEQESDNFDNLDFDASQEQVSAKQDRPEKKEPPKGSISKDAFINALLEQKSGGRGGKKS